MTDTHLSYKAFLGSEDDGVAAEWVDGKVILTGSSSSLHQELLGFLLTSLTVFAEESAPGTLLSRPFQMKTGAKLPGREPDLLYLGDDNRGRLKDKHLEGPADLAIEITSPESRARDRGEKFYEYEQGGVAEYWLIDPDREQAEFYRPDARGIYQLVPLTDGVFESKVLAGLKLDTVWLWQDPLPPLLSILRLWKLI